MAVAGAATTAILGPFVYIALSLTIGMLWADYDPIQATQSELGAVDSPYRHLMNFGGFFVLGVSILCFAVIYRVSFPRGAVASVATGLFMVAGIGMGALAFFPCDAGCVDVTTTGRIHGVLSAPGAIGLPGGAMLSALVLRRDGRFGTAWQATSFWVGLLSLCTGPVIAADLLDQGAGLLQRAAMWAPLLWMAALSWRIVLRSHIKGMKRS